MVVLCCIVVVTGFLPSPVSRSSLSSPPSQVILMHVLTLDSHLGAIFWYNIYSDLCGIILRATLELNSIE